MSSKHLRRAASVGVLAGALLFVTPAVAAHASIYTWKFYAGYATSAECETSGRALVRSGEADAYRCDGPAATELYLAYTW